MTALLGYWIFVAGMGFGCLLCAVLPRDDSDE